MNLFTCLYLCHPFHHPSKYLPYPLAQIPHNFLSSIHELIPFTLIYPSHHIHNYYSPLFTTLTNSTRPHLIPLLLNYPVHRERNLTYIDEAAAIQFALRRASASDNADTRNHTIALLSDLQQQQSNEISMAISKIKIMVCTTLVN